MQKTRVLIVDDSPAIQRVLREILSASPKIDVVGFAADPYEARDRIKALKPDVLTLDVEMPRMDGLTFLKNLMRLHPMPVIMISTLTQKGADVAIEALRLGAFDYVGKPQGDAAALHHYANDIITKVLQAHRSGVGHAQERERMHHVLATEEADPRKLVALGASTGGVEALYAMITAFPEKMPPMVVVQHIPPTFSSSFAKRLNQNAAITVLEAEDGMVLEANHLYLAPGGRHTEVMVSAQGQRQLRVFAGDPVKRHCPSVDVMFSSVARSIGKDALGVILTGMGDDGAEGLLAMRQRGSYTLGQNEQSSMVYGMPRAAMLLGAVEKEAHLQDLTEEIVQRTRR